MSSYKNIIFFLSLILLLGGCTSLKKQVYSVPEVNIKEFKNEDLLILFALEAINQNDFETSFELFVMLYNSTNKYEYLQKTIDIALLNQQYEVIVKLIEDNISKHKEHEINLKFVYALSLMNIGDTKNALEIAKELLDIDKSDKHYILIGNLYLITNQYGNALKAFDTVLKKQPKNIAVLLIVSDILYLHLENQKKAITLLEAYINNDGCNIQICEKIYSYYMEQNNIDGMISTLKKSYDMMIKEGNQEQAIGTLNIIVEMLKLKDVNLALEFVNSLQDSEYKMFKLVELYTTTKNIEKVLHYLNELYVQTNNVDILAQMAISQFELAENKKEVLSSVVEKFNNVLLESTNHMYQNYLGYLLIDYDLDYDKGLKLVKMALQQEPKNHAYLDSLAWGYYKIGDCVNAYQYMFDLVNEIGIEHEEIKFHWEAIKNCKE